MSGEMISMLIVTAHQGRFGFIVVTAALLAGALALRWSHRRRWYDSVATFLLLTVLFTTTGYLALHVLLDVPVAGFEVVTFRD